MTKPQIILIGAGGHAVSCIDVVEQEGKYGIAGLVGDVDQKGTRIMGYEVIGGDADLPRLAKSYQYALITVGQIQTVEPRIRLYVEATSHGLQLPIVISPRAYLSRNAVIGAGTILMHGSVVNAGAKVGTNCIINTGAILEHGVAIGANCHISTGAILNGDVRVGDQSFIGSGSLIKESISIGERCLIGMGLTIRHNLMDDSHYKGDDK